MDVAFGWHILKDKGSEIVWHNGGTGGYHSFVGFDPKAGTGVVVLSNCAGNIDDIGRHILNAQYPLVVPVVRKAIAVDPKIFDDYVGAYALTPQLKLTVFREGDKLYAQTTPTDRAELLAGEPDDVLQGRRRPPHHLPEGRRRKGPECGHPRAGSGPAGEEDLGARGEVAGDESRRHRIRKVGPKCGLEGLTCESSGSS